MSFENSQELAQNKLLLLYIISKSNTYLTNNEITEFVLENNYMNYFLIQQYLSDLKESGFIKYKENDEKKVYILLEKGQSTLHYFEDRINKVIKEEISNKFLKIEEKELKAAEVSAEYYKKNNTEYMVNLKLVENSQTLLSLYISVISEGQAKKICDMWKSKTEHIYKNLINMLVDDNITLTE